MSVTVTKELPTMVVSAVEDQRRREDPRLLAGRGRFVGDFHLPGEVHACFRRTSHAHARLLRVDTSAAQAASGVLAAVSGGEIQRDCAGLQQVLPIPALPTREVYFIGQAVAFVVARDRYVAEDACERIVVDEEPLPAAADLDMAAQPGAPLVDLARPSNLGPCLRRRRGDVEAAFREADVVIRRRFRFHRASGHPLETRSVVAAPDPATQGLVYWSSTQRPHAVREALATGLGPIPVG